MVIWVMKIFLYNFSVFCCHLLICSDSVRSFHFCPLLCLSLVSLIFLKRSLVFLILLFSSISLHCSLKKAFLSLLAVLWNAAFRWVYLSFSPLPLAYISREDHNSKRHVHHNSHCQTIYNSPGMEQLKYSLTEE